MDKENPAVPNKGRVRARSVAGGQSNTMSDITNTAAGLASIIAATSGPTRTLSKSGEHGVAPPPGLEKIVQPSKQARTQEGRAGAPRDVAGNRRATSTRATSANVRVSVVPTQRPTAERQLPTPRAPVPIVHASAVAQPLHPENVALPSENPGNPRNSLRSEVATLVRAVPRDPDAVDGNIQEVAEYAQHIHEMLLREQLHSLPDPAYLDRQPHLSVKMRAILVDWLVDVAGNYKLSTGTLFLLIRLVDKYLDKRQTARKQLQLVGVACMMIASKFEEVYAPEVRDFVYISADAYTAEEVINMETQVLAALDFRIVTPTSAPFFERITKVAGCDETTKNFVQFLLELALVEYSMIKYLPSHLVAAAMLLARRLFNLTPVWPNLLAEDMDVSEATLEPCVQELRTIWRASERGELQAVRKKFKHSRYGGIADFGKVAESRSSLCPGAHCPVDARSRPVS